MGILLSHLLRKQTMHDEDQRSLQAVQDSEDISHNHGAFFKQEGTEHPHQTQYAHLGNCSDCESSDFVQFREVWVKSGKLLGKLPDSDDEEEDVEDDDEAHRAKEAPDEAIIQGQPAVLVSAVSLRSNDGRYNEDNKRCSVTSDVQVEGPDGGIKHQDHHAVQLHPLQQHPGKHSQEEEMEHGCNKSTATHRFCL